jgi:hypothetical protein
MRNKRAFAKNTKDGMDDALARTMRRFLELQVLGSSRFRNEVSQSRPIEAGNGRNCLFYLGW